MTDNLIPRIYQLLYGQQPVAPRIRRKPMQVICVGLSRSATESLSEGLKILGYSTYHGWDIVLESKTARAQEWDRLARRKFRGAPDGDCLISTAEFDALLGHVDVVVDVVGFVFAAELIEAYPDAKVILNTRRDLEAWHQSAMKTLVAEVEENWTVKILHLFHSDLFWAYDMAFNVAYPAIFRSPPPHTTRAGIETNGKWIYREHSNTIRGLVPKERLLEWSVEDSWDPLCKFLGKEVPNESFPWTNNPAGFAQTIENVIKPRYAKAMLNCGLFVGFCTTLIVATVVGVRMALS